jgi:hypothetical protein
MTCTTCGSVDHVHEQSNSYQVPGLAWVRTKLLTIAWVRSSTHVHRCPDCGAFYSHRRVRDTDSGTAEESLVHTDKAGTVSLLLTSLTYFPMTSKEGALSSLEELLGPPEVNRQAVAAGDPLALFQAGRTADPELSEQLEPHAAHELGARALAACGALAALVRSNTPAATRGLGRMGRQQAVPHLLQRLHHEDWRVRQSAAWALGEMGVEAPALLELLSSDEPWGQVKRATAEALARVQDSDTLVSALQDGDSSQRSYIARGLMEVGRADAAVIEALSAALVNCRAPSPAPQMDVMRALRAVAVPRTEVADLLEAAMAGPDGGHRHLRYCLEHLD